MHPSVTLDAWRKILIALTDPNQRGRDAAKTSAAPYSPPVRYARVLTAAYFFGCAVGGNNPFSRRYNAAEL